MLPILRRSFFFPRLILGLIGTIAVIPATTSGAESPANYTLFVGVDLFLEHQDKNVLIRKLERKRALLENPDRTEIKITDEVGFHWKMATKVSGTVVTIDDLTTERAYSPRNDPKMAALKTQANLQSYLSERLSVAQGAVNRAEGQATFASAAAANPNNSTTQSLDQTSTGIQMSADSGLDSAMGSFDTLENLSLTGSNGLHEEDATFDAFELAFNASSPHPVSDAFAVVFAKIKSGDIETSISFHHEIGRIDSTPRRVRATKTGFPQGFQILSAKVHLFSHGEEIASNLSEKRYGLTPDQAREYLSIDHIGSNPVKTIPARPAWSIAPAELFATDDVTEFDLPITVEVGADGRAQSWSNNGRPLPARIQSIMRELTFLPALEQGKPVASTANVNLAEFFKN